MTAMCEEALFWRNDTNVTASPPFKDCFLLHFTQERCVVAFCDFCTLFELVDQQYPNFVPKIDAVNLEADYCVRNFFGRGEPLFLQSLDLCLR